MRISSRAAGLVTLILVLVANLSACQLVDRTAPTAVPAPGQGNAVEGPAAVDQSPRIRDPKDVPPTWTPAPTARSETPLAPEAVVTVQAGGQASYTVQAGDTLAEIAIRFNVTLEALAAANGIEDFDHIEAGQVLIIPR